VAEVVQQVVASPTLRVVSCYGDNSTTWVMQPRKESDGICECDVYSCDAVYVVCEMFRGCVVRELPMAVGVPFKVRLSTDFSTKC
jgi:hypothetical protein